MFAYFDKGRLIVKNGRVRQAVLDFINNNNLNIIIVDDNLNLITQGV